MFDTTFIVIGAGGSVEATGDGNVWLLVIFFILTIAISGFCSVWEAVLLSVTTPYIQNLKDKKPKVYERLNALKSKIDRPLISLLTLNTIAHTLGAMLVATQLANLVQHRDNPKFWNSLGTVIMIIAILVLSEILPKNFGARRWKALAPAVGNCLHWLSVIMTPVVWVIGLISRGGHHQDSISREELIVMAEMGRNQGHIDEGESRVVENVFSLQNKTVESIMTPRVVMFSLPGKVTVREYLKHHVKENAFSRIPIYEGDDKEEIIGFVLKDEILIHAAEDKFDTTLSELCKDVAMMSELTKLPEAFKGLQTTQSQLAVVHDEFGGVTGIVSMEDFTEELWGIEIVDEADKADDMQEVARQQWQEKSKRKGIKLIKGEDETGDSAKQTAE